MAPGWKLQNVRVLIRILVHQVSVGTPLRDYNGVEPCENSFDVALKAHPSQIGKWIAIAELKTASMGPINDTSHIRQHLRTILLGILGLLPTAPQGGTFRHCKSVAAGSMSLAHHREKMLAETAWDIIHLHITGKKCWLRRRGTLLLELPINVSKK